MNNPKNVHLILSIESSGNTCGATISSQENIIAEYSIFEKNVHDRLLGEVIRRLLVDCRMTVNDLSAVAVSSGPGSFTGLRIGVSIAKGLCFGGEPKLISVPTLSAIAYEAAKIADKLGYKYIIPVINSHKDLVWYQIFNKNAEPQGNVEYIKMENIFKYDTGEFLLCGPGCEDAGFKNTLSIYNTLKPVSIANIAHTLYSEGKFVEPDSFTPELHTNFEYKKKEVRN